jgi:hypothetical protein
MSEGEDEGQQSMSTDLKSDIAFMNRQKELRAMYRDFQKAIGTVQATSPPEGEPEPVKSPKVKPVEDPDWSDESDTDVETILEEIEAMEAETNQIYQFISGRRLLKDRRFDSLRRRLRHLSERNAALRERAESLLEL